MLSKAHAVKSYLRQQYTKDYHCATCQLEFKIKSFNCNQHLSCNKHLKLQKPQESSVNKKSFNNLQELWNCSKCADKFTSLEELKVHFARIHVITASIDSKPIRTKHLQCALCNRRFSTQYLLNKHLQLHSNAHTCSQCNAKFMYKRLLTKHTKQTHKINQRGFNLFTMPISGARRGEKPKCFNCNKQFVSRWALNRHLKIECNSQCIPAVDHLLTQSTILNGVCKVH